MLLMGRLFVVGALFFSAVSSSDVERLGDLPEDVIRDLLTTFIEGTVHVLGNCSGANDSAPQTNYYIYTQDNPNNPQIVTELNLNLTSERSKIIFLIYGWHSTVKSDCIVGIKNAYLTRYNAFVIMVNWAAYNQGSYFSAYCAVPGVASNVANVIYKLKQDLSVSLEGLHAVGHSLGAQIMGIAGNLVYKRCGEKIGRITGLDPAGPFYDGIDPDDRLDPSDALFVDVMHTNEGQSGYLGSCGHLDLFANCGFFQPGCAKLELERDVLENISAILDLPVDLITCSHKRSCTYFQESILSDKFVARQCIGCGLPLCSTNIFSSERKIIGEDCSGPGQVRNYVFQTHSSPPFAEG